MAFLVKKRTILLFMFTAILIASIYLMFRGNLTKVVYNNDTEASSAKNAATHENIEAPD